MSYAIDVQALRERAANRVAKVANAANRLTEPEPISQLATLATSHAPPQKLMTAEQADACHAGGWTDAEIRAFADRRDRLLRWGYAEQDADNLAERLALRDREGDDRRLCLECSSLAVSGRCTAAGGPLMPLADRRLEPVRTVLQRCPAFGLRPELRDLTTDLN